MTKPIPAATLHVSMPARTCASAGVATRAASARPANAINVFLIISNLLPKRRGPPNCEPQANFRYAGAAYPPLCPVSRTNSETARLESGAGLQQECPARQRKGVEQPDRRRQTSRKERSRGNSAARDGVIVIVLVEDVEHGSGPEEPVVLAAELHVGGRLRGNKRLNVGLVIVHPPGSKEPARHIKREPLRDDIPAEPRIARPLRHQRDLVARKRAFAECRIHVSRPAAHAR